MATETTAKPRLSAQQKRDREFMKLLDESLRKQAHELGLEYAKRENDIFGLGFDQGEQQATYEFSRLTRWQRLWWKP